MRWRDGGSATHRGDGDGLAEVGVFRRAAKGRFLRRVDGRLVSTRLGVGTDDPFVGDWGGDGVADLAVRRPTTGRFTPLTGLCVTAFLSHRYSNSDDSAARRCRTVWPLSARVFRSSRQAITWARVTLRNSSERTMPVKRMKSASAFS